MRKIITLILVFVYFTVYAQTSPGVYRIKNVKINTKYSDFGTAFYGENKVVFASPKQGIKIARKLWDANHQPYLDLFIGEVNDKGEIINKQKMPGDINTKYHEGVVSFSKDMKTVYFSANRYIKIKKKDKKKNKTKSTANIQIFKATINKDGEWTNLIWLPFNSNQFSSGHPALNKDDTKLYFVSDRPGSYGKTDIFVVDIYEDGTYSEPRNLGDKINTPERDMFPFISHDNILYFSSDGREGYGELDVFATKIFDTTVSEPINLEGPVNSEKDDFAYIINDETNRGYFSSNRDGAKGDDDIYSFKASPPIFIECKQMITGIIKDENNFEIVPKALIVLFDEQDNELQKMLSNETDGSFNFDASCNTTYKLRGYIEGYLIGEVEIKTVNDLDVGPIDVILNVNTDLIPKMDSDMNVVTDANTDSEPETDLKSTADANIAENTKSELADKNNIKINTIYFDFDKYNIRYDAKLELDRIVKVMKEYPEMAIDVSSHADSRGTYSYNIELSNNRAESTIQYLVNMGIDSDRLSGKGFGEGQLVTNCPDEVSCTEYQHQLNRRSEFLVKNAFDEVVVRSNNRPNSLTSDMHFSKSDSGEYVNYDFTSNNLAYTVQIGAFRGNGQSKKYNELGNLFNYRYNDGLKRYFSGQFKTSREAHKYMKQLRKKGFEGAFVVGLKGDDRI
jgi:outer membrane protein OmpA-like peptidoglycan-associated protein